MATRVVVAGQLLLACTLLCPAALAQDARAGREKAKACTPCHGADGIAIVPNAPNLAGENAVYVRAQLEAFKAGMRQHEQMSIIAAGLSGEDIADLATWFSAIEVTTELPDLD